MSHSRPYVGLLITNSHHTVDKIGVHLKNKNYNIFLYSVKQLNFSVILLNILDYVTQIYSKIIKSMIITSIGPQVPPGE